MLKPPSVRNFSMSTSGGPLLRHCQASFMTASSRSVNLRPASFAGAAAGVELPVLSDLEGDLSQSDIFAVL